LAAIFLLESVAARQVQVWRNSITLWEHAIRLTPGSSLANQCLGDALSEAGQFERAIPFYELSLRIDPEERGTLNNYALRLAMCHQTELRDYELAIVLARRGCEITQWEDPKLRRTLAIAYMNYATDLKQEGQFDQAIEIYDKALAADPTYEVPMFNLALLLASSPEPALRQPEEATRLAEEGLQIVAEPSAVQLAIAARVFVHADRLEKGLELMRRAVRQSESEGATVFTDQLRAELRDLQNRRSPDEGSPKG
jgi:tetratricopeptide (TPR) repeat protein